MSTLPLDADKKIAGANTAGSPAQTVARTDAARQTSTPGTAQPAKSSVPLFGGYKGGKKRKDGLKPGSPEAIEATRLRDAARKRDARVKSNALLWPPVLPTASEPSTNPGVPPILPLAGANGSEIAPQIAWLAKDIEPLAQELVALTEEIASRQITSRCRKANFTPQIVREIEKDAQWSERSKKMLAHGSSELSAKAMNESGISPEWLPVIEVTLAGLQIGVGHVKILNRLDKLIAANNFKVQVDEKK